MLVAHKSGVTCPQPALPQLPASAWVQVSPDCPTHPGVAHHCCGGFKLMHLPWVAPTHLHLTPVADSPRPLQVRDDVTLGLAHNLATKALKTSITYDTKVGCKREPQRLAGHHGALSVCGYITNKLVHCAWRCMKLPSWRVGSTPTTRALVPAATWQAVSASPTCMPAASQQACCLTDLEVTKTLVTMG